MAREKDVFGFDEFEKAMTNMLKRYDSKSDVVLAAQAQQLQRRVKQVTAKGPTGKLKKSWRALRPKVYPNDVKVSRVQTREPHGHLYELGHEMVTTGSRRLGAKVGKTKKYNRFGRAALGIKSHGRGPGRFVLEKSTHELRSRYTSEVKKLLDDITKDLEV